jgi:hypothetical protein
MKRPGLIRTIILMLAIAVGIYAIGLLSGEWHEPW